MGGGGGQHEDRGHRLNILCPFLPHSSVKCICICWLSEGRLWEGGWGCTKQCNFGAFPTLLPQAPLTQPFLFYRLIIIHVLLHACAYVCASAVARCAGVGAVRASQKDSTQPCEQLWDHSGGVHPQRHMYIIWVSFRQQQKQGMDGGMVMSVGLIELSSYMICVCKCRCRCNGERIDGDFCTV